jgi:hypothetical protein
MLSLAPRHATPYENRLPIALVIGAIPVAAALTE